MINRETDSRIDQLERTNPKTIRESVSKADMQAIRQEGTISVTKSSAGPGGQNVNKTAKTAEFRWTPADSTILNDAEKERVTNWMQKNKPSQFVGEGEIYITSTRNKSLASNKRDVMKILHEYLSEALKIQKVRKVTKPSRSTKEKRLKNKKTVGRLKKQRGSVGDW